ncbi:MAG: hypothetical protein AAF824_01330 [Bacteroidota bacterium]
MAKTIKFNLLLEDKPVRDLEGVKENFNIHELLEYYENGLLVRWLKGRGFLDVLRKVESIDNSSEEKTISGLISAFGMELSQSTIKEAIYILQQMKHRRAKLQELRSQEFQISNIIEQYHQEFYQILQDLETNRENFPFIKTKISLLSSHYQELVKINIIRFYLYFIDNAPLVIFATLMDKNLRDHFLNDPTISNKLMGIVGNDYLNRLPFNFMASNAAHKQKYWRVIGKKDQEYMMIRMEDGNYVRNLERFDEALTYKEVNGMFPILKGVEYQSAYPEHKIIYLPCSAKDPFWTDQYKKKNTPSFELVD